jgi:transcriptional regulator with XRE-family HTH domain
MALGEVPAIPSSTEMSGLVTYDHLGTIPLVADTGSAGFEVERFSEPLSPMARHIDSYIRRERRKWGLTQQELASLLGQKSRARVSALEHGHIRPNAEDLVLLSTIFGLTPRQLFPRAAEDWHADLLRRSKRVLRDIDAQATLRAQRKIVLLRQIHSRAVMS